MAAYVEKYEVTGKEQDVAEWWKLADKAAQETNCTLSEDFGGSDVGDIIHSLEVLKRHCEYVDFSKNANDTRPVVHIENEMLFISIPGETKSKKVVCDSMEWTKLTKEYAGVVFSYHKDFAYIAQEETLSN